MKKIILAITILIGATNLSFAQSAMQNTTAADRQKAVVENAKFETNKVKYLQLSDKQQTSIYNVNVDYARKMFAVANPSHVDKVALNKLNAEKAAEYKKILSKEQYAQWEAANRVK